MKRPSQGPPEQSVDVHDPRVVEAIDRYWRKNVMVMAGLLGIWAVAGLGCGVLFADILNQFRIGGFPLGFWFAQQGSIIAFVLLILAYGLRLNRLDARHHREIERIQRELEMRDTTFGWTVEMQVRALQMGLRIVEVPVSYRKRVGVSKITGTIKGTILAGYKILTTIAKLWLRDGAPYRDRYRHP